MPHRTPHLFLKDVLSAKGFKCNQRFNYDLLEVQEAGASTLHSQAELRNEIKEEASSGFITEPIKAFVSFIDF